MKKIVLTFVLCSVLYLGYGQSSNNPCSGVTADFSSVSEPAAGGIRFTNTSVVVSNTTYSYSWDFGNGQVSNEKDPFMVFEEGTYLIKMTVIGHDGCKSEVSREVVFSYNGQ